MVPENYFGRTQMFSAFKLVNDTLIDTFLFNLIIIWITILVFYFLLIFNVLRKIITLLSLQ
jgi:ABC transport system ATP-binding/permease protein